MKRYYYYVWFSPWMSLESPKLLTDSKEQKPGSGKANLQESCDKALAFMHDKVEKGIRGTLHCVCTDSPLQTGENLIDLQFRALVRKQCTTYGYGFDKPIRYTLDKRFHGRA